MNNMEFMKYLQLIEPSLEELAKAINELDPKAAARIYISEECCINIETYGICRQLCRKFVNGKVFCLDTIILPPYPGKITEDSAIREGGELHDDTGTKVCYHDFEGTA